MTIIIMSGSPVMRFGASALLFVAVLCLRLHISFAAGGILSRQNDVDALLWQISGNGLVKPSYLFGTIHLICKKDIVMPPETKRCFAASKQLALEFDITGVRDRAMTAILDKGVLMRDGMTLGKLLDSADYALLDRYFRDSVGMSLQPLERFKPLFLTTFFLDVGAGVADCEETSYEEEFAAMAQRQKKPIKGVETIQQQLELFDRIPYKEQAKLLANDVREIMEPLRDNGITSAASRIDFARLTELYKQGKIGEVLDAMRSETAGNFEEILLNERNRLWIPVIEQMIHSKSTFIAVGAGHLPGKNGVVALLRSRGYTLTPLK